MAVPMVDRFKMRSLCQLVLSLKIGLKTELPIKWIKRPLTLYFSFYGDQLRTRGIQEFYFTCLLFQLPHEECTRYCAGVSRMIFMECWFLLSITLESWNPYDIFIIRCKKKSMLPVWWAFHGVTLFTNNESQQQYLIFYWYVHRAIMRCGKLFKSGPKSMEEQVLPSCGVSVSL